METERAGEEFLTAEQQRRYGRYAGDPDQAQLDRYFHLDAAARELVDIRRGEHNRLGFAVQLGTVRFLGTFLAAPTDVPWAVASHLAGQLGIADPGVLKQYAAREGTNRLHAGEIQRAYGYRDFADPAVQQDLVGWLQARTRLASERPGVLFDLATARLLESKVLLPGPTVLARLVASIRDQAATRLWEALAAAPDATQRAGSRVCSSSRTGSGPRRWTGCDAGRPVSLQPGCWAHYSVWRRSAHSVSAGSTWGLCLPAGWRQWPATRLPRKRRLWPGWVSSAGPRRCSPRRGSWRRRPMTMPWTCSTSSWLASSRVPTAPASGNDCGRCQPSTWPPRSSATR